MLADGALVARKDARIIRCPSRAVEFWSERPISERIVGHSEIKIGVSKPKRSVTAETVDFDVVDSTGWKGG